MKKLAIYLVVLMLIIAIFWHITYKQKNANIDRENISVVVIKTSLEFNVEDIINAFNVIEPAYLSNKDKEDILILNKVEPKAFYYLDGALLAYIFENEAECDKAVEKMQEVFTEEKFLASSLIEFPQTDFKPYIYKANNALAVYVPRYTINTKMNWSMDRLIFLKEAGEKGLTQKMLNLLSNLGLSYQEILDLTQAEMDRIFAPGTHLDGYGFDFSALTEKKQKELLELGINSDKSIILNNLGYEYEDMVKITKEELDLIFPNTEIIANLEKLGLTKNDIDGKLKNGLSYKDIIKETLNLP